jgi:hypothetical protein
MQVNSRECETYLTVRGVPVGGRYNPYPSNQSLSTRGSPMQVHPGNSGTSSYVNVPGGYDCYTGIYGPGLSRTSYPAYPINYEDEGYNGQSPPYMLPNNNDSMLSTTNVFGSPASPRTWDVFSSSARTQNSLYSDQNPPTSVSLPNGSYSGSAITFPANSSEAPSTLSGSSTIATSMTSLDRILPNPAMGRSQQPGVMVGGVTSLDGLAMSNVGYRNSIPWIGSDGMSNSSQSSDRVMSIGYPSTMDSNGSSGDSSTTTQDSSFAYIPLSHSSTAPSVKATTSLTDPVKSDSTHKPEDSAAKNGAGTLSEESTPSPETHPMAEAYGYSGEIMVGGRRSTRGSLSSGTLANGQEYTRLRPLPIPTPELYRSSQQDSSAAAASEYQVQMPHRTSIASLSSSSARY